MTPPLLPKTENPLVLRTDFTDPAVWTALVAKIRKPVGIFRFRANLEFLDDPRYAGLTKEQVMALLPADYPQTFILLVDAVTIAHPDHPILVVDLFEGSGQEFRALPGQAQGIENNLSLANMDFEDFASAVDADGVFRGFPGMPWYAR